MALQPLTPQNGSALLKGTADKPPDSWQGTSPQPSSCKNLKPTAKSNLRPVEWLNFFLADVQTGLAPFLAAYLAANAWNPGIVGFVLIFEGLVGVTLQTPAGAIIETTRYKRGLIAAARSRCIA